MLDTRTGIGASGRVGAGETIELALPAPSGATAAVLNVTATDASPGYIQVFPTGRAQIGASSNLNVEFTGQTIANLVVVPLGDGGRISFYSEGGAHLLADVTGYFVPRTTSSVGRYVAQTPTRIVDTRLDRPGIVLGNPGDTKNCATSRPGTTRTAGSGPTTPPMATLRGSTRTAT